MVKLIASCFCTAGGGFCQCNQEKKKTGKSYRGEEWIFDFTPSHTCDSQMASVQGLLFICTAAHTQKKSCLVTQVLRSQDKCLSRVEEAAHWFSRWSHPPLPLSPASVTGLFPAPAFFASGAAGSKPRPLRNRVQAADDLDACARPPRG